MNKAWYDERAIENNFQPKGFRLNNLESSVEDVSVINNQKGSLGYASRFVVSLAALLYLAIACGNPTATPAPAIPTPSPAARTINTQTQRDEQTLEAKVIEQTPAPIPTATSTPYPTPTSTHEPTSTPLPTPTHTPTPASLVTTNAVDPTYVFGPGVSPQLQETIQDDVERVRNYSSQTLGFDIGDFTIFAFMNTEHHIDEYIKWHEGLSPSDRDRYISRWSNIASGHGGYRHLFVCTGCDPDTKRKSTFHEYFHVLQSELANVQENPRLGAAIVHPSKVPPHGPEWLHEGTAEYLALEVASDARISRFANQLGYHSNRERGQTLLLSSMETRYGLDEAGDYSSGIIAAKLLAETSGISSLIKFYENVGKGLPWKEAFEATFGRSINAFYSEFKEYKLNLR